MEWIRAKSVDDLKKRGTFSDVKEQVQTDLSKSIQIKARGWDDLFEVISKLQEMSLIYEARNDAEDQQSTTTRVYIDKPQEVTAQNSVMPDSLL